MNEQIESPLKELLSDWSMNCVYVQPTEEQLKPENRRLRYRVVLYYRDRRVLDTPYEMGVGHIPGWGGRLAGPLTTIHNDNAIKAVLKSGSGSLGVVQGALEYRPGPSILPELSDVLYCLVVDSSAIGYRSFEDWAAEYGYDSDSRKAESIYKVCLETGLTLRAVMGGVGLQALRDAFQDY